MIKKILKILLLLVFVFMLIAPLNVLINHGNLNDANKVVSDRIYEVCDNFLNSTYYLSNMVGKMINPKFENYKRR